MRCADEEVKAGMKRCYGLEPFVCGDAEGAENRRDVEWDNPALGWMHRATRDIGQVEVILQIERQCGGSTASLSADKWQ